MGGKVLMYRLTSRRTFVANIYKSGERLRVFVSICMEYCTHNHIILLSGIEAL